MTSSRLGAIHGAFVTSMAALAAGCAAPIQSVQPTPNAPPGGGATVSTEQTLAVPRITITPAVVPSDGFAVIRIQAAGADSIAFESTNGVDRYGRRGGSLSVRVNGDFGMLDRTTRYAVRERGVLLDVVRQPVKITTCRGRECRVYYDAVQVKLPVRNERSVALTAGWSTAFTRRAITGVDRSVLLREAINNTIWSVQGEIATHGINARLQGYYNNDEQGGSVDLSRTFKQMADDGFGYGIAMHFSARSVDWLRDASGTSLHRRGVYQASVGPSIMLKGLTASSQIGLYTDGMETLQLLSTLVSLNGNLTDIWSPLSLTFEKTFAFGGGPIISRRRDGAERMMFGVQVAPTVALRFGVNARRSSWPIEGSLSDIQASEVYYSVGAQYTISW